MIAYCLVEFPDFDLLSIDVTRHCYSIPPIVLKCLMAIMMTLWVELGEEQPH